MVGVMAVMVMAILLVAVVARVDTRVMAVMEAVMMDM
jgi:hypothetical protein